MQTSTSYPSCNDQQPTIIWDDDFGRFSSDYQHHPFLGLNPLYGLPTELLTSLQERVPGLLTVGDISFERALANLCSRHNAVGIFHGKAVTHSLLQCPPVSQLSAELFRRLGWDRFVTLKQARDAISLGVERLNPLRDQLTAYVGWLLTNPQFLAERDELRARWGSVVENLEGIPFPVRPAHGKDPKRPRHSKLVETNFVDEFLAFFDRWELQSLVTWDLPEPRGANLSGYRLPASVPVPTTNISIDMTSILRLPAGYALQAIMEETQRQRTPAHLRPWLDIQDQLDRDGLRYRRLGRMFEIAYYRDIVLASRYRTRFAGNIEKLDQAFADSWDKSIDTVKKLRNQMASLRNNHP